MTLAARLGTEPYVWAISGLPEGLTANAAGEIIGTPTRSGAVNVSVVVVDASGARSEMCSRSA
jgi:hypothetical protein